MKINSFHLLLFNIIAYCFFLSTCDEVSKAQVYTDAGITNQEEEYYKYLGTVSAKGGIKVFYNPDFRSEVRDTLPFNTAVKILYLENEIDSTWYKDRYRYGRWAKLLYKPEVGRIGDNGDVYIFDADIRYDIRTSTVQEIDTVYVKNEQQFLEGLANNRMIIVETDTLNFEKYLKPINNQSTAEYTIDTHKAQGNEPTYSFEHRSCLILNNYRNLHLTGKDNRVQIVIQNLTSSVLKISDSEEISIDNFALYHENFDNDPCSGNVLVFDHCKNILVSNCELNGSGAIGASIEESHGISFKHTQFYNNSFSAITSYNSYSTAIYSSIFFQNKSQYNLISVSADARQGQTIIDTSEYLEDIPLLSSFFIYNSVIEQNDLHYNHILSAEPFSSISLQHCGIQNNRRVKSLDNYIEEEDQQRIDYDNCEISVEPAQYFQKNPNNFDEETELLFTNICEPIIVYSEETRRAFENGSPLNGMHVVYDECEIGQKVLYGLTARKVGEFVDGYKEGVWKEYQDSSGFFESITYEQNIPTGTYQKVHEFINQNTVLSGEYVEQEKVGEWNVFDCNDRLFSSKQYEQNYFTGEAKIFYPTGELRAFSNPLNGRRNFTFSSYYKNGDIKYIIKFTESTPVIQTAKFYDQSGNTLAILADTAVIDSTTAGVQITYSESGKFKSLRMIKNGVVDGFQLTLLGDLVFEEYGMVNGIPEGEYIAYDLDDYSLWKTGEYKAGLKNGTWYEYYSSHLLQKEEEYKDGILDGIYRFFDEYGLRKIDAIYKKGVLVER